MKARCIRELPDNAQTRRLGSSYDPERHAFHVVQGREYLVYGLELRGGEPWVEIADEYEQLSGAPLCLFEITDPRVSSNWEARVLEDGAVCLWPPQLYQEGFFEDLLEQVPEVVDEFRRIRERLERGE